MNKLLKHTVLGIIMLGIFTFLKLHYVEDSSWRFEKEGYSMELVIYKNIFGEKRGSYCFYDKFIANCPFSTKREGEWDRKKMNVFQIKNSEYLVKDNRSNNEKQSVVELIEKGDTLKWILDRKKTKDYFNIPYNIELHKVD